MIANVQELPLKHQPGDILDSAQTRLIHGENGIYRIPVGTRLTMPDHMHKIHIPERIGGIWVDRFFVNTEEKMGAASELIPVYMKVYDGDEAAVVIFLKGVTEARKAMGDHTPCVTTLKDNILDTVLDAVYDREDVVGSSIREYALYRPKLDITNDEVRAYSDEYYPGLAGYPWDLGNIASREMLFTILERQRNFPKRYVNDLEELDMDMRCMRGRGYPLRYELCDIFETYLPPQMHELGLDPVSKMCVQNSRIPLRELIAGQRIQPWLGRPTVALTDGAEVKPIPAYSSEILCLCVWLHQCPFAELIFRTTLPNRNRIESFRLISASARTHTGVDMALFQLELSDMLRTWDSDKYSELIVVKTATEELILELTGVNPKDSQRLYIDLFMTTLMSQALVREKYKIIETGEF